MRTGRTDGFEPDPRRDEGGHDGLEYVDESLQAIERNIERVEQAS